MNKQEILRTLITELGFSIKLSRHCTAMTVGEMIIENPELKGNKDWINVFKDEAGKPTASFVKSSNKWRDLKNFLIKNGFTHKDSVLLLPETGMPKHYDLSLASKDQIKKLPFRQACNIKPSATPYDAIANFLHPDPESALFRKNGNDNRFENISVSELLSIGYEEAEQIIKKYPINTDDAHGFRKALELAQSKLFKYGFSKKDGKFMQAYFGKPYKDQLLHLVCNKGFTTSEAKKAITLGKRAGWI